MIKPYEPYPMMLRFKTHQGITKGEVIQESIGGRMMHFKVTDIRSIKTLQNGSQEVILMVRELPGGDEREMD